MTRLNLYFLLLIFSLLSVFSAIQTSRQNPGDKKNLNVAHGKYLVGEVAKCTECHTPRDSAGNLKNDLLLQGAPIWIKPVAPIPNWADQAPPLAGIPSFTDAQMENVLEKGIGPNGETLRPPMHIYHMHRDDALAIIAYLKSLTPAKR